MDLWILIFQLISCINIYMSLYMDLRTHATNEPMDFDILANPSHVRFHVCINILCMLLYMDLRTHAVDGWVGFDIIS